MSIERLFSYYWNKDRLIKPWLYVETPFRAVHEKHLARLAGRNNKRLQVVNKQEDKMKMLICFLFLMGCAGAVRGEEVKAIDMNAPLADARLGLAWNLKGDQLGVAYVPLMYIVGSSTAREYATLNLGASDVLATGKAGYLVSFGVRVDTVFAKLGETAFAKKYLRFAILPPLQISPTLLTSDFKHYGWWLSVSSKFGGK